MTVLALDDYFDGDSSGASWDGTADGSTSTLAAVTVPPSLASAGAYTTGADRTSLGLSVPSGVASGDLLYAFIYAEANVTWTPLPSGFALVSGAQIVGTRIWLYTFWKRATAADTGTYTFTASSTVYCSGGAVRVIDAVASGDPHDTGAGAPTSAVRNSNGTTTPAVSLTTQGADRLLLWCGIDWNGGTWTVPTGFTAPITYGNEACIASKSQTAAGATGSITGSNSTAEHQGAALIAILPAVAATAPTVSAGSDVASHTVNTEFTRTATENDNGSAITDRSWTIQSGPDDVGVEIGTAAALAWTPDTTGTYTLRYSATNAGGTTTDDMSITVETAAAASQKGRGFLQIFLA